MRMLRCLLVSGSAAVMAAGLLVSAGAAAGDAATQRPVAHPAHQPSARFLARARTTLEKYLKDNHPTIMLTHPGALPKAAPGSATDLDSFNWSGYADAATNKLPDDAISAAVARVSAVSYSLRLTDTTHPSSSFSVTRACAVKCLDSSAEWISERPSFAIGIAPLANYGSWLLTNAQATFEGTPGNIASDPSNYRITMQDATASYRWTRLPSWVAAEAVSPPPGSTVTDI
jgi:hypothetical protein